MNYRSSLETIFQNNETTLSQIYSCNLTRLILETNYTHYSHFELKTLNNLSEMLCKTSNRSILKHKSCLNAFVSLYKDEIKMNQQLLAALEINKPKIKKRKYKEILFTDLYRMNLDRSKLQSNLKFKLILKIII